jgi:phosphate transport system substrate-binding protein
MILTTLDYGSGVGILRESVERKENAMNKFKRALAAAAAAVICLAFTATPGFAQGTKIVVDGSTTVGPIAKAFAEYFMSKNPGVNITVSESGSGNGAKSLINGTCEIATMSRFMKDEEFKAAVAKGVLPVATIVAVDGLAIVVHPSSPVQGLTIEQIRDIYIGKITNWKEVGGPNVPIVLISRDTNSGTYESFEELVMKKQKISDKAEYVGSSGAIRARVQSTPAAIGYVGLGFVDKTIKAIKVNGVVADNATVTSGEYPVARPLFMFTNGAPKMGSKLHNFLNLYLTQKGQQIVEEIGFVPVTKY